MTLLILPRGVQPRSSRPSGPFAFNKDSPQAQGLVFWAPAYTSGKLLDLTQRNQPTVTLGAAGEWNIHPVLGRYVLDLPGADNHFTCSTGGFRSDQGTICAWWELGNLDNHRWMYSEQGTANNNNEIEVLYIKSSDRIEFTAWQGTTKRQVGTDTGAVEINRMIPWAASWDSQAVKLYKDGVLKGTASGSSPTVMAATAFWGARAELDFNGAMKFGDCRVYDWSIPASLVAEIADPIKRDDLVYELGKKLYFFSSVIPAVGAISGNVAISVTPSGNLSASGIRRISQLGTEIVVHSDERRISQLGAEVAAHSDERRVTQLGVEIAIPTDDVGWVPFAFTPSMRLIGSAQRGSSAFIDGSIDSRGIPLGEALLDCPTGVIGPGKVVDGSIQDGAVSIAHSFASGGIIDLNQNNGTLIETHRLQFELASTLDMQIFFTGIVKTTDVQGDHMLLQAEIREDGSPIIDKAVIHTLAKGNIDHLFTVSFRAAVPVGLVTYTIHMNINDNSTAPTVRNRTMFAREIKV